MTDVSHLFSDNVLTGPRVSEVLVPPNMTFNFDQGVPAEETFPIADLAELHAEILRRDGPRALEYVSFDYDESDHQLLYPTGRIEMFLGHTGLRREIAAWLSRVQPGSDIEPDGVILALGSVHAISLGVNAFVNPDDGVMVESTTFPYAFRYMQMRGGAGHSVAIDEHGLDVVSLEDTLEDMKRRSVKPKLLYTVATFHLPTGVTSTLERRQRILALAHEYDFMIIEDNIYGDLRYAGEHIPTLLALDTQGRVMQSHGFSKIVAPGLRLGWMSGPPRVIAALAAVRQDLGVSQLTCRVMAEYMNRGLLDPHIARANEVYRRKRDIAVEAMNRYCGDYARFAIPQGGFYLWVRLDQRVDLTEVEHACEARGVACRPGERFSQNATTDDEGRYLRLAFSHVSPRELERGIAALGDAIRSAAATARRPGALA
jgi:2-aminoadipate transaminase